MPVRNSSDDLDILNDCFLPDDDLLNQFHSLNEEIFSKNEELFSKNEEFCSLDMWKKFGLPPTPPSSPPDDTTRLCESFNDTARLCESFKDVNYDPYFDFKTEPDFYEQKPVVEDINICDMMNVAPLPTLSEILECEDVSEFIRHDCMWSGKCPNEEHKKKVESHICDPERCSECVKSKVYMPHPLSPLPKSPSPCGSRPVSPSDSENGSDCSSLSSSSTGPNSPEETVRQLTIKSEVSNNINNDHCYYGGLPTPSDSGM